MLSYLTASITSELVCFLFALVCLITDKSKVWRSMILYMLITCVTEIYGLYLGRHTHYNQWVYNIFLLCEAGFTNLMFGYLLGKYIKSKPVIFTWLALFLIVYIAEIIYHSFWVYNNTTYTVESVQFVLYALYYYYLLLKDERYIDLRFYAPFWWVAGVLFFYFGNTACNLFDSRLEHVMITANMSLDYLIFKVLNVILYGCWSYAFICKKWLQSTSKTLS